eukprot:TRINITY_DN7358_c0_g1_i1.p1 TRINITY_DN7358_c0_g1~~TRINITY_DN7358_c0_g1_i1.p1  ORF type:complete len:598 (-),score=172.54 TRINITY_DN7358_c0_g1_i1:36-1829(-)
MQQSDVDEARKLFEIANDGKDSEDWLKKFQVHADDVLARHRKKLDENLYMSDEERRSEYLRAKMELNEIVMERIAARPDKSDAKAKEALEAFRAANQAMIEAAVSGKLELPPTPPGSPGNPSETGSVSPAADDDGASTVQGNTKEITKKSPDTTTKGPGCYHDGSGARAFAQALSKEKRRQRGVTGRSRSSSPKTKKKQVREEDTSSTSTIFPKGALTGSPSSHSMFTAGSPGQSLAMNDKVLWGCLAGSSQPRSQNRRYAHIHQRSAKAASQLIGKQVSASRPGNELSFRQLKQLIDSVYDSKAIHDQACFDQNLPSETLEQHLYAFLNKRYGVRSVVTEWAQAILKAAQKYSPVECEVTVFLKILGNSLSESFAAVQDTLRASVQTLLRKYLYMKNSHRSQAEMENLWRARLSRGIPFAECDLVVRYMYNERDAESILRKVRAAMADSSDNPKAETNSVRYRDLVQILLRFQMELTENFLADFVSVFKMVDADEDGIVNHKELSDIVDGLLMDLPMDEVSPADANALTEARVQTSAAIRGCTRATFSECVDIFTGMISARWTLLRDLSKQTHMAYRGGRVGGTPPPPMPSDANVH